MAEDDIRDIIENGLPMVKKKGGVM